jgi:hypothetical protein
MKVFRERIKLPEMARLLSRSAKQFRVDVKKYSIPHLCLGRDKLFDPEEVERFLTGKQEPIAKHTLTQLFVVANSPKHSQKTETETLHTERYKSLLGLT